MSKFCPACDETYPESASRCAADGAMLLTLSADEDSIGRTLEGRYTLRAVLGEGGMGKVYLAEQPAMHREVAVKVLHPWYAREEQAVRRFMAEARAASRLSHPNTIRVFDFGQSAEGLLYMVLELLRGSTLSEVIAAEAPLPPARAVAIIEQVCGALAEAHAIGIIHRDIKPDNIVLTDMVGRADHVTVLDFGVAKVAADAGATQTGTIIGTPHYMSPEQITSGAAIDGRSDEYAVAAILYELLTGRLCFPGDRPMQVMLKHVHEAPPPLSPEEQAWVPAALAEVVFRGLAKDRDARYDDTQAFAAAARAALTAAPPDAEPSPDTPELPAVSATAPFVMGRRLSSERMPRLQAPTPSASAASAAARRASMRTSATGSLLRPLDLLLTHAPSGHRFRLIAVGVTRGVLQCLDQVPRLGVPVLARVDDLRLRGAHLTFVVVGPESGLTSEFVSFRLTRVAASIPRALRDALQILAPGHEARLVDDDQALEEGFLLAFDPSTGVLGAVPVTAAESSSVRAAPARRQVGRRVLEISSRKGARPRPKRSDDPD